MTKCGGSTQHHTNRCVQSIISSTTNHSCRTYVFSAICRMHVMLMLPGWRPSVRPSVCNVGGLCSATNSGNGHMAGYVGVLATCERKLIQIVVSCDSEFYGGKLVGYGKMWHPTARMSHYLSICVASCYFSINVTILRLLTFLLFVSTFFYFRNIVVRLCEY